MSLLSDIGQCICGIIFPEGIGPLGSAEFTKHITSGEHQRCLEIEVCGPCFMGFCKGCEKSRRNEKQFWKCRCMHDFPIVFDEAVVSILSIKEAWSDWLENGRPSTVSLGLEEPQP